MIIEPSISSSRSRHAHLRVSLLLIVSVLALAPPTGLAQVGEGRQAMAEGDHLQAVELLTGALEANPTPETYVYLGLAHSNLKQYDRALELFAEASRRYPTDPRFLNETAGVHLANRDVDLAREALAEALRLAPRDQYAADLLASLNLSEGDVRGALDLWNEVGQPEIDEIFQNFSPSFLNWEVPIALKFGSGDILGFDEWKTTEARLLKSRLFSNVTLELEPSPEPDLYNAIIRTSPRTNARANVLFDLLRGLPVETTYLNFWDLGGSGVSWRSSYRWDEDRRRVRGQLLIPLPLPGLPILDISNTWRSEQWDLAASIRDEFQSDSRFDYKVNAVRVGLGVVPDYRLEINASFEYRNRAATGNIESLGMNSRNSGTFRIESTIRTMEGRYKNLLRFEGFLARSSVLGDFDFSGGSIQVANRYILKEASDTSFNFSLTGGWSGGDIPVDSYFLLGIGRGSRYPLRGHVTSDEGRYGRAPMGTDFVLINTDVERRLVTVPLFNTLGIPYIMIKAMGFFDRAKVFDANRIFRPGEWLNDVGAGLRFETPTGSFTVLYGRDITDGVNNLYGYVERRFW